MAHVGVFVSESCTSIAFTAIPPYVETSVFLIRINTATVLNFLTYDSNLFSFSFSHSTQQFYVNA